MAQTAERQRVQFFLPADVHEGLRVVAFQRRTSQQKLVVQWLRDRSEERRVGKECRL